MNTRRIITQTCIITHMRQPRCIRPQRPLSGLSKLFEYVLSKIKHKKS